MADNPTPDEIIDAIRNAGWLLEQDSARVLESHDFRSVMGWAYTDPDDPSKSREMDVHGMRRFFHDDELKLSVTARILVECKQSAQPFVLIGRSAPEALRNRQPTEHVLRYQRLVTGKTPLGEGRMRVDSTPAWTHLGLHTMPGSPSLTLFRASQMTRLEQKKQRWVGDNSGIFNSLMYPLAKALRAAQQGLKTSEAPHVSDSVRGAPPNDWIRVALHFPIVVTSAPLYAVDATKEDASIASVDWATMTRQLRAATIEGTFNIDVVAYSALSEYLSQRVVAFAQAVAQAVEAHPARFTSTNAL